MLREEDSMKKAFFTNRGVYEFAVSRMPFSFIYDAAILQRVIEETLGNIFAKVCFFQ